MKIYKNFESRPFLFCHPRGCGDPDSIKTRLDSRSPRAGATPVDGFHGNDGGGYLTKNLSPKTYHLKPKAGFVMLFSVLIASLLVVVGLSIFNITLKEMTISTAGRESQVAFFAANSGLECALYWDLHGGKDKNNEVRSAFASYENDKDDAAFILARCGEDIIVNKAGNVSGDSNSATTVFNFNITTDTDSPCADVKVIKEKTKDSLNNPIEKTTIQSQGTNTCVEGRKVQRGLQATLTR